MSRFHFVGPADGREVAKKNSMKGGKKGGRTISLVPADSSMGLDDASQRNLGLFPELAVHHARMRGGAEGERLVRKAFCCQLVSIERKIRAALLQFLQGGLFSPSQPCSSPHIRAVFTLLSGWSNLTEHPKRESVTRCARWNPLLCEMILITILSLRWRRIRITENFEVRD